MKKFYYTFSHITASSLFFVSQFMLPIFLKHFRRLASEHSHLKLKHHLHWQFVVTKMPATATMDVSLGDATIDIKRKYRLLKVCYVPATSTAFLALFCCDH
jgi:hypothetical protein